MSESFILSTFVWSYSRVTGYQTCPYGWKKQYIDCLPGVDNGYAIWGSYVHSILEKFFKGELSVFDISQYYQDHYKEIRLNVPDSYYQQGLDYFDSINFDFDRYEVLGTEKNYVFDLGPYKFTGFIDLLLQDNQNGDIILVDHKSYNFKRTKRGIPNAAGRKFITDHIGQLYLYSKPVIQEYGKVDKIGWNFFRSGDKYFEAWNEDEYQRHMAEMIDTIKNIYQDTEFKASPDSFFCENLCSQRINDCPYRSLNAIYSNIHGKCTNPRNPHYQDYGGIGIDIQQEWLDDKNNFFKWALDNGYEIGMILKRADETLGYNELNCYFEPDDSYGYCEANF